MLIAGLIALAKTWKQLKCSSKDEWVHKNKQIWCIHTMKYFSAVTRNGWTLDTQK